MVGEDERVSAYILPQTSQTQVRLSEPLSMHTKYTMQG
jgi:hypothetical protein